jgi:DNA-binding MarR family transcriptional regulator
VIVFVTSSAIDAESDPRYDQLLDLPPSAKLVYLVLKHEGPLTQQQLCARTLLSGRTARSAVSELEDVGLVTEEVYIPDARKKLYRAQPVTEPAARE